MAAEVARLRGRVPVRELSARLKSLGRPILPSGITKIEQGQRRVDCDDLVALAVALKVTPNRLLFGPPPPDVDGYGTNPEDLYEHTSDGMFFMRLADDLALEVGDVWSWAVGEDPLGNIWALAEGAQSTTHAPGEVEAFRAENRPPPLENAWGRSEDAEQMARDFRDVAADALDLGLTKEQVRDAFEAALAEQVRTKGVREENEKRYNRLRRAAERSRNRGKG